MTGELLGGGDFDSDQLAGKVIVYNVWGSWCAPCRKEAPALEAAAQETADVAQFVGINTRDLDQAPAIAFNFLLVPLGIALFPVAPVWVAAGVLVLGVATVAATFLMGRLEA